MKNGFDQGKGIDKQMVHTSGVYYVCYELSKRGWNVVSVSPKDKGVDVVIRGKNGKESTIQVRSISEKNAAGFNDTLDNIIADFTFVVNNVLESPNIFIVDKATVKSRIKEQIKDEKKSYWFEPKDYNEFKDNWDIIGDGTTNSQNL